jgi:zinc transport system substrate-binding protein
MAQAGRCAGAWLSLWAALVLTGAAGCGEAPRPPRTAGKVAVVASIFPLADVAQQVGGEDVAVTALLPPGQSPHEYEPQPRQAEELTRAHLLLIVGPGIDLWAERSAAAAAQANPRLRTLVMTKVLREPMIRVKEEGAEAAGGPEAKTPPPAAAAAHGHGHEEGDDPHVWLDPVRMQEFVRALAKTLSEIDPAHAAAYARRASAYDAQLKELDQEYARALANVPRREFVSFHAAFTYAAARYGLKQAALFDPDVMEFGPKRMEQVADFMKQYKIKTIFAQPQYPVERLESLAKAAGAKIGRLDDIGNPAVPGYDSYLNLMRSNLKVLVESLKE